MIYAVAGMLCKNICSCCILSSTRLMSTVNFKYKALMKQKPNRKNKIELQINNQGISKQPTLPHKSKSSKINIEYEILYGIHPVLNALQSKRRNFRSLFYKNDILNKKVKEICELCQLNNIPSYSVEKNKLNKLTTEAVHQGVCLEASVLEFQPLNECYTESRNELWILLDGIKDPMNFGAIIRSACFFGVHKVIVSSQNCCPITAVVSKASAGAAELYPIYKVNKPEKLLSDLQDKDWQIISSTTDSENYSNVCDIQIHNNALLIIGNEGEGVSKSLENHSNSRVSIPSNQNSIQSLNVSVATSILIHSLLQNFKS